MRSVKLCIGLFFFVFFSQPKLPTEAVFSDSTSFLSKLTEQSPFRFVTDVVKVAEGQTVTLSCSFENSILIQSSSSWSSNYGQKNVLGNSLNNRIIWTKYDNQSMLKYKVANGEHLLPQEPHIRQSYQVFVPFSTHPLSLLIIRRVPYNFNGFYVCRSAMTSLQIKVFYLHIVKPILSLLHTEENRLFVNRGHSINLSCNTSNNFPSTAIYWTKRGHRDSTQEEYFLRWGSKLKVKYANIDDEGFYTCHVNNYLDRAVTFTYDVRLGAVHQKKPSPISASYNGLDPSFLKTSKAIIPKYGELYILSCRSNGKGINFRWFRNKTDIISGRERNLVIHSNEDRIGSTVSDLIIKRFTPADRNRYTCEAINNVGYQRFTFILSEIQKLPNYMKQNRNKYAPRIPSIYTSDDEDLVSELTSGDGSGTNEATLEGSGDVLQPLMKTTESYVKPENRNKTPRPRS